MTDKGIAVPWEGASKLVAVVSGGLDSVTLAHKAAREFGLSSIISFNYGQRHKTELQWAMYHAENLGVPWHYIDLSQSGITEAIAVSGSSLVSDTPVPEGHYGEDSMKATIVPNRNMM